jgi:hypothetical protein
MKQVHAIQIKALCIQYAVENELKIETLDNDTFRASSSESIIDVPISFLYDQVQNGWDISDTLQNETCYNGEE